MSDHSKHNSYAEPTGGKITLPTAATHVAKVRKLFPDRTEEVSRLALSNGTFRSLCEEYGLAVDALDLLELRNRPHDVEKMYEYRALIKELQSDLRCELFASQDHGSGARKE